MEEKSDGITSAILGTTITITGIILLPTMPMFASGIIGFGLAHIVIGGVEIIHSKI